MDLEKFNREFKERQKQEEIKDRRIAVVNYLKQKGFEEFISDGKFFLDKEGRRYGDNGLIFEYKNGESGIITHLKDINNKGEDIFNLIYLPKTGGWPNNRFYFMNDLEPSPERYNGFYLWEGLAHYISAIDGSFIKIQYPLLMLKSTIEQF